MSSGEQADSMNSRRRGLHRLARMSKGVNEQRGGSKGGPTMSAGHMIKLVNGGYDGTPVYIPALGFGVHTHFYDGSVAAALKTGYRHIDIINSVGSYPKKIGQAVRESGIPREEIFVTTKEWCHVDRGYEKTLLMLEIHLEELGFDYVDLFLIISLDLKHTDRQRQLHTWRAMEQILKSGKAKSIGVWNYGIEDLKILLANCQIRPSINQLELHPFNTKNELVEFCEKENIVLAAYFPPTRWLVPEHEGLLKIACQYKKSASQILYKWGLQRGFVVLSRRETQERMVEIAEVFNFEINDDDMKKLNSFDGYKFEWSLAHGRWFLGPCY